MIYRLRYCNKDGIEARVDIQKGLATPVIEVEGTGRPFILSYNNDKGDKSGMFLSSSADIEIYETTDFNIDNLKTSNETELTVTHYIDNVVSWQGFIIPDFFSIEVRNNPVITMTASDRLGTLKNVTLSDLPSMINLRELAILCLNKTGLSLPLRTMADFNNGTGTNDFFNSKILAQRLSDTKGRSISCYDILSSILTASNSFLVQRSGGWHIINKIQHEAGSGKLYTGERTFVNWADVIFNFSDISIGGRRTIIPVASTVGVYHEHGGGRLHPDNYDFSKGLTGWSAVGDFTASIDNRQIDGFQTQGGQAGYFPIYGAATENSYLVNYNQYERNVNPKYLESAEINIPYNGNGAIEVEVDVNATGPLTYPGSSFAPATLRISVVAVSGTETLTLDHGGKFIPMPSANPPIFSKDFGKALPINGVYKADSIGMKVKGTLEVGSLENYKLKVRIYGGTGGRTILVNMVSLSMKNTQEIPKGTIYKTEKGDNFTKAHDIETAIFGDYLTNGLNGYFYNYPIDDTSSLYNSANELTSKWTAYNDTEQLPLLQHVTRQKSRLFSVAHDLLNAEIEVNDFDPLAIFVACEKRYTVVSAQFDFFKSNLSVELEEVAFQSASVRDFIYSYFGDGESGIKSIGGISGGGGGGSTGGGLTPEQLEILSWWKKDPDRENTIFTEMNAYSTKELSAYGLGSGSGGGGGGSLVTWGTELNSFIPLTVEGISKTVALQGHTHTKAQIGLGNVDNTSDLNKPISTATQTALNSKLETSIFNTHNTDNIRHITGAERTKWDGVVTDFDELEIGGRNLLLQTQSFTGTMWSRLWDIDGVWNGFTVRKRNGDWYGTVQLVDVKKDDIYTFSCFIKIDESENKKLLVASRHGTSLQGGGATVIYTNENEILGAERGVWHRLVVTYRINVDDVWTPQVEGYDDNNAYIYIAGFKLEKGTKATDWTPAPEDQVSDWNTTDVNSFSYIKNKPTKLSDFTDNIGIGAHIANNIIHITSAERTNWNTAYNERHTHTNKAIIDQLTQADINVLAKLSLVDGNLKVDTNLYSTGEVSAYGLGSGSGGGGGSLVVWGTESNGTIPLTVEGVSKTIALKSGLDLKQDKLTAGSGITIVGNTISSNVQELSWNNILDKPLTYTPSAHTHNASDIDAGVLDIARIPTGTTSATVALGNHTHTFASLTSKPTTLAGYGITDATSLSIFNTHNTDNIRHITGAERTKWDTVVTDFAELEIGGRNLLVTSDESWFRFAPIVDYLHKFNFNRYTYVIPCEENQTYTVSRSAIGDSTYFVVGWITEDLESKDDENDIPVFDYNNAPNALSQTIETGNNAKYITVSFGAGLSPEPQVTKGTIPTDWTPAPEDQVSDWNTTDIDSFSFIKNKPTSLSQFTDNIGVAAHIANKSNPHSVTKAQVGLGNVDNTSDLLKPISTATQTALNLKANLANPTFTGNIVTSGNILTTGLYLNIGEQINAYSATRTELALINPNVEPSMFMLGSDGVRKWSVETRGIADNYAFSIHSWSGGGPVLRILNNGNVGIGTTSPAYKLDVSGTGRFTGNVTAPTFIGALSGNATSATALQTARTLWGQSFNGEANVSGAMTGVTSLAMTGALSGATTIEASTSVASPKVIFNSAGWSMEQVGSELQMKHNNVLKMRFTSAGSIVATEEITAFG